ncbi:MAG: hypothetical protein WD063_01050 [Pirellulales bacterium]
MLATLNSTSSRVSWTLRALIAAGALAVLASPLIYLTRPSGVKAEDPGGAKQQAVPADREIEFLPAPTPSEEKILAALAEQTKMQFIETPLQDAVEYLKSLHKIEIQLDSKALEDATIGSDTPVTRQLKDIKLSSALNLLLRDLDLTYIIRDEILLITTPEQAESQLLTRTYPVGDLVDGNDAKGYDSLIEAITSTVKPPAWDEVGGPGSIKEVPKSKSLVISQTRECHDEVLELLRALRAARKAPVQELK